MLCSEKLGLPSQNGRGTGFFYDICYARFLLLRSGFTKNWDLPLIAVELLSLERGILWLKY